MDPAQLSTLVIVAGLALDKFAKQFDLYSGVKRLHFGCSSCCVLDVDRSAPTPPSSPQTGSPQLSGPHTNPLIHAPAPVQPMQQSLQGPAPPGLLLPEVVLEAKS